MITAYESGTLTIPGTLPGLNDYIAAERGNAGKYKAALMKKRTQDRIARCIRAQLRGAVFTRPVIMRYTWIEPNRRRDKDNIAFAKKFIQDALVESGVLPGDGWKHIDGFSDSFGVNAREPRVIVEIAEIEGIAKAASGRIRRPD